MTTFSVIYSKALKFVYIAFWTFWMIWDLFPFPSIELLKLYSKKIKQVWSLKGIIVECYSNIHLFCYDVFLLTLSWTSSLSYRNQTFDLLCKSMDWFLYDRELVHERVKRTFFDSLCKWLFKKNDDSVSLHLPTKFNSLLNFLV